MEKSSSIFNFKRLPWSVIAVLLFIWLLEVFLFSRAYLLADRSTLCIVHKAEVIRNNRNPDIALFGASRALAVDAKLLEESTGGRWSVYNYSLPHLGTTLEFYLTLKKYLKHNPKPRLIMLSVSPEMFGVVDKQGIFIGDKRADVNRFRRFFSVKDLLLNVGFKEKWGLLRHYVNNLIPSFNYRTFISDCTIKSLKNRNPKNMLNLIERNQDILSRLRATNGQMLYHAHTVVSEKDLLRRLPACENGEITVRNISRSTNIEKFIELADENNIPTVLFFMPILSTRYRKMEEAGYLEELKKRLRQYERKYPHFQFYDINPLNYEREYFGDWSHLNQKGAERFNREFINCFQEMLRDLGIANLGIKEFRNWDETGNLKLETLAQTVALAPGQTLAHFKL